jgi:hypothetical protein
MVRAFARMNGVICNFCQKHSPTRGQNDYTTCIALKVVDRPKVKGDVVM